MSSFMSTENGTKTGKDLAGWGMAIKHTEQEILRVKSRLAGLRSALRSFKRKQEAGEPWPTKRVLGQDSDL